MIPQTVILLAALVLSADLRHEGLAYRWTDVDGSVRISGRLEDVPKDRRNTASPMKLVTVREDKDWTEPFAAPMPNPVSVHFNPPGSMAVEAMFNGLVKRNAILDTGSETIIITSKLAAALGADIRKAGKTRLRTSKGIVEAPVVFLDDVNVGGAHAMRLEAAVMDFPGRGHVSAIIGMNFLSRFVFEINARDNEVTFHKAAGR
ncbi:MAG: clan AA aspartic protease [Nitrospinae bacterium]|nr:clan AA aspartic protease [Nitrospinota bacterium]